MAARHRLSATTLKLPFVLRISAPVPTLRDLSFLRGSNLAKPVHPGFTAATPDSTAFVFEMHLTGAAAGVCL